MEALIPIFIQLAVTQGVPLVISLIDLINKKDMTFTAEQIAELKALVAKDPESYFK
ncbi:MAG: hypothetical protein ABFC98_05980 [Candidatus Cloacimonas sp.]